MTIQEKQFETEEKIYAEQVALLYHNAPLAYISNVINATLLIFVESPYIPFRSLLIWYSCLMLLTAFRTLLVYQYYHTDFTYLKIHRWNRMYLAGTGLSGLIWGSSAIYLFPTDVIGPQYFVVIILAGMTAASVSVLAARLETFLVFVIPAILPLSGQLFYQGDTISTLMAVVTLIFLVGITIAARSMHRTILTSLTLRFDNHELLEEIEVRVKVEQALFQEKDRLLITLASLAEGVVISSADSSIEFLNPAAEQLTGYSNAQAEGQSLSDILTCLDENTGSSTREATERCLKDAARSEKNILLINHLGKEQYIEEIATPLKDPTNKIIGAVTILRDVTLQRKHQQQLAFQANHDALTRLPNRTLLLDRIYHAIAKAKRDQSLIAILFIDLDRFKAVNDTVGHAAGDMLLVTVAERLLKSVREQDTVARLGGDEYIIVLENITQKAQVSDIVNKITNSLLAPFTIKDHEFTVTSSIGMSVFPEDGEDAVSLLKNADAAMYSSKKLGRNRAQFFVKGMNSLSLDVLTMEQQLRQAVNRNELELYYQPQINLKDDTIVAVEALLRWRHPQKGIISPSKFIPIAEATGSIPGIGRWVLNNACKQIRSWHESGYSNLRVAVNISIQQFEQDDLIKSVSTALADAGLSGKYLELEITESQSLSDIEGTIGILQAIKTQGVKWAIDDFGTGYSSLSYLKELPVDVLKIDKSFIHGISENSCDSGIVSSIIAIGHVLNLSVIAEGIETQAQLALLKSQCCDGFQGFYYSPPLPADEMTQLLHNNYVLTNH